MPGSSIQSRTTEFLKLPLISHSSHPSSASPPQPALPTFFPQLPQDSLSARQSTPQSAPARSTDRHHLTQLPQTASPNPPPTSHKNPPRNIAPEKFPAHRYTPPTPSPFRLNPSSSSSSSSSSPQHPQLPFKTELGGSGSALPLTLALTPSP